MASPNRICVSIALSICFYLTMSNAHSADISWKRHAFPLPQAIWAVESIDVNDDEQPDLIAVGDTKAWAFMAPDWQRVQIGEMQGGKTIHAVALDCDADGDQDLALGRSASDWIRHRQRLAEGKPSKAPVGEDWTVAWLENIGTGARPWPMHVLDTELHGVHGLWTGDVNGDGVADLLADSFAGPDYESSLAWFEAPSTGQRSGMSQKKIITRGKATGRPHYMDFADLDGDGQGDVLLGASTEGSFTWWQQPVRQSEPWKRRVIGWQPGATHPRAADLNQDGKIDVLGSAGHGNGVYWYEAPDWQVHSIDQNIRDVHAFDAADLDGDGDVDCAGCSFTETTVRWWENLGKGNFRTHTIDDANDQQAYDLKISDLDGDGRLDILLAGRRSENVVWYQNSPAAGPAKR